MAGDLAEVNQKVFLNLIAKNKFASKGLKLRNGLVILTGFGEQFLLNESMRVARLKRQSSRDLNISDLAQIIAKKVSETYQVSVTGLSGDLEMKLHDFFLGFDEFLDEDDEYAEDGVYDLVFEIKKVDNELKYLDFVQMTVVVHYFGGSKEVKFQAHSRRRGGFEIKRASSSRLAQESFKRGDMVMILTVKPGQNGSYSNPGRVEAVMGDEVRVSVGMAHVIKPARDLVKATGRKSENIKIWQANH